MLSSGSTLVRKVNRKGMAMNQGQLDDAIRRALNILDKWIDVTGFVEKNTGYYYELQSVIEDAVHCGAQAATGDFKKLEIEEG